MPPLQCGSDIQAKKKKKKKRTHQRMARRMIS